MPVRKSGALDVRMVVPGLPLAAPDPLAVAPHIARVEHSYGWVGVCSSDSVPK